MSRKSQRKRQGRRKKNSQKIKCADVQENSTRRKLCRSSKKKVRKLNKSDYCVVCQEKLRSKRKNLCCGHSYHKKCIKLWTKRSNPTCPLCRANIESETRSSHQPTPEARPGSQLSNPENPPDTRTSNRSWRNRLRIELPVFFFPVICCRCLFDSNGQLDQNYPSTVDQSTILWEALLPLVGSLISINYTLVALNSPIDAFRNPLNNPYRRYIDTDEIPTISSTPTDARRNPSTNPRRHSIHNDEIPTGSTPTDARRNPSTNPRRHSIHNDEILRLYTLEEARNLLTNRYSEYIHNDETPSVFSVVADARRNPLADPYRLYNRRISSIFSTQTNTRLPLTNHYRGHDHNHETPSGSTSNNEGEIDLRSYYALSLIRDVELGSRPLMHHPFWQYIHAQEEYLNLSPQEEIEVNVVD